MTLKQADRVAVVTGGGRGIGAATSRQLAEDGATVVILDTERQNAEQVAAGLPHGGVAFRCDIADRDEVRQVIDAILERFGRIDVVVNNAGMTRNSPFVDMPIEDWDAVVAVNLTGPFNVTQAIAPTMVANCYGRIVFVSSLAALGNPGATNYSAAKSGIFGLAKTIALELGPFGITSNVVAPGYIETDMAKKFVVESGRSWSDVKSMMAQRSAVKRIGQPEDIASVVAYLALPETGFITGQTIYSTGGPVV